MKLSELVAFRNQLDELSVKPAQIDARMAMERVLYLMQSGGEQFDSFARELDQHSRDTAQVFDKFEATLDQLKQQVDQAITQEQRHWFQESYNLYDQDMAREKNDYILNRRQNLSSQVEMLFMTRLKNYTDWRFPALIVRPGLEPFVEAMVSNDPLYLVDQHRDLLRPAIDSFAEAYQRRLRPYVVNERESDPILARLPDSQFGLCLIYNFFNFRPIEIIRRWLTELQTKMRPGGVVIMTINDCDRPAGVILAESYYCCYTPGRMIMTLAESLGFEIIYTWKDQGPITWIEMRRAGELDSMRGGQTLAKIVSEPVAQSK